MRIGLVARVPHDLVLRRVEQVVQGDGQFHHAEVGCEVPADVRDHTDDLFADLLAELGEPLRRKPFQIRRAVYGLQQRHSSFSSYVSGNRLVTREAVWTGASRVASS